MFVKELLNLSPGAQQPTVTAVEFKGTPQSQLIMLLLMVPLTVMT
jgi:hypothetical protein